jgi:hypothetical protein
MLRTLRLECPTASSFLTDRSVPHVALLTARVSVLLALRRLSRRLNLQGRDAMATTVHRCCHTTFANIL